MVECRVDWVNFKNKNLILKTALPEHEHFVLQSDFRILIFFQDILVKARRGTIFGGLPVA